MHESGRLMPPPASQPSYSLTILLLQEPKKRSLLKLSVDDLCAGFASTYCALLCMCMYPPIVHALRANHTTPTQGSKTFARSRRCSRWLKPKSRQVESGLWSLEYDVVGLHRAEGYRR